jgi:2-polyprenyl-3-methyl-5-hydroxy-6-metoxy-1,4-benzoquinol methylase
VTPWEKHTPDRIGQCVSYFTPKVGEKPTVVEVCEIGNRWASCPPGGRLCVLWKCIVAPQTIIDCIVVHEPCHLRHGDCTDAFWNEVDKVGVSTSDPRDPLAVARELYEARSDLCRYVQSLISIEGNFYLLKNTLRLPARTVLDVGFGKGGASVFFGLTGKSVTAIRPSEGGDIYPEEILDGRHPKPLFDHLRIQERVSSLEELPQEQGYDLIWMSHILEHTLDVGTLLRKARRLLSDEGWLCVVVPPFKHQVVMGHVSVGWNLGLLMHALLVNGFEIKNGHFIRHGYNLCGFVQKGNLLEPMIDSGITYDELSVFAFTSPSRNELWPIPVEQGFVGDLDRVNWFETPPALADDDPDFELALGGEDLLAARAVCQEMEVRRALLGENP